MHRSCWWGDLSGSCAVIFAVVSVAAEVRALALPDYTSLPNWNNALAAVKATVQDNIAAGALLNDFNANNRLQKIQTSFRNLSWTKGTAPANLKGCLDGVAAAAREALLRFSSRCPTWLISPAGQGKSGVDVSRKEAKPQVAA